MATLNMAGASVGVGEDTNPPSGIAQVLLLLASGAGLGMAPRYARVLARQLEDAADVVDSLNSKKGIVK